MPPFAAMALATANGDKEAQEYMRKHSREMATASLTGYVGHMLLFVLVLVREKELLV